MLSLVDVVVDIVVLLNVANMRVIKWMGLVVGSLDAEMETIK